MISNSCTSCTRPGTSRSHELHESCIPPNLSSSHYSSLLAKLSQTIALAQTYSPRNIIILDDFDAGNTFIDPKFTNHSPIMPYESALHDEITSANFEQLITQQHDIQKQIIFLT